LLAVIVSSDVSIDNVDECIQSIVGMLLSFSQGLLCLCQAQLRLCDSRYLRFRLELPINQQIVPISHIHISIHNYLLKAGTPFIGLLLTYRKPGLVLDNKLNLLLGILAH
jgi:hypothetical protein